MATEQKREEEILEVDYRVDVYYERRPDDTLDEWIGKIAEDYSADCYGSGFGFFGRDFEFLLDTGEAARKFAEFMRSCSKEKNITVGGPFRKNSEWEWELLDEEERRGI